MKLWKGIALVNGASLIGICFALFIVPPHTPLWLFATIAGVVVLVMNFVFIRRFRQSDSHRQNTKAITAGIITGFFFLILDLVLTRLRISPFGG